MAAVLGARRGTRAARLLPVWRAPTPSNAALRSHTVVCVAYFAFLHEKTPHPVAMMAHLARTLLQRQHLARASHVLCELTYAPMLHVCAADDALLLDTLRHGIQRLGCRTSPRWVAGPEGPAHPALALATLYDHCIDARIVLPCDALSSLVATLARSIHRSALVPMLDVLAADVVARAPAPYTSSVLAALVHAYGRAKEPHRGEQMLAQLAVRHGATMTMRDVAMRHDPAHLTWVRRYTGAQHMPHDVPVHALWTKNPDVWNALIRARILAGHVVSARIWLERFRLLAKLRDEASLAAFAPPKPTASPYLTLMHALSTSSNLRQLFMHVSPAEHASLHARATDLDAPFKTAAMYDILALVREDRVIPGVAMLNLLASFEAGCGRLSRAVALVTEACLLENGPANVAQRTRHARGTGATAFRGTRVHISSVPVLFTLCAAHARQVHGSQPAHDRRLPCEVFPSSHPLAALAGTPRAVLRLCQRLVQSSATSVTKYIRAKGMNVLNAALDAMLATNDWQGAWYVLQLYGQWNVEPNAWTQLALWRRLSTLSHGAASGGHEHALQHAGMVLEQVLQAQGLPLPNTNVALGDIVQ
ncbi:lipoyl(octanoyl) transferase [Malassezia caprae]|uniref:Lipoyl(Octanoyl) transferase n=1 Tax=Malassezia caprae TaxID=1381934 RepID=A0AAF0E498_9BASI|nr:lipoyl(octanoyl) transferase [Malassezia caprae]